MVNVPRPDRLERLERRKQKQVVATQSWRERNRERARIWARADYRRKVTEGAAAVGKTNEGENEEMQAEEASPEGGGGCRQEGRERRDGGGRGYKNLRFLKPP